MTVQGIHRRPAVKFRIIALVFLVIAAAGLVSCDFWMIDIPTVSLTTAGASWSNWVLEALAEGIIHYSTDKSLGWVLSAFSGGEDSQEIKDALSDMEGKLSQIETDLHTIENELDAISRQIDIDTDTILDAIRQGMMSGAKLRIENQFANVQLFARDGVPGSAAAAAAAQQFSRDFLTTGNDDMDQNVYDIYGIIMNVDKLGGGGALNVLTTLLVAMANDGRLMGRYQTLESYFNSLLEVQMKGGALMIEALHQRDDPLADAAMRTSFVGTWPGTAQQWYEQKFLPQIAEEVEEFLRCAERLVLADADLRTDVGLPVDAPTPFLPADADAILSRADFLAAQVSPSRHDFGLVVRAVGEPISMQADVGYLAPSDQHGTYLDLYPLGTDKKNIRYHAVEVWNHWPAGWTHAYMQWQYATVDFHGSQVSDYLSYNTATSIAVVKYGSKHIPAGVTEAVDWIDTGEPAGAYIGMDRYNDKMEKDPAGKRVWGHATLAVRHRPRAWRRYDYSADSYDSYYFDVTNDYNMTDAHGPWVRLIATLKRGTSNNHTNISLESSLSLPVKNGEAGRQKVSAIVQMTGDASGELLEFGTGQTLSYWWTGDSGETDWWNLRAADGFVYDTTIISHVWEPGEFTPFHFKLNFIQYVDDWIDRGSYVGSRVWPGHVFLFF